MKTAKRCVLLFARTPRQEGKAKGIAPAELLFASVRDRIARASLALPDVDLIVMGEAGSGPAALEGRQGPAKREPGIADRDGPARGMPVSAESDRTGRAHAKDAGGFTLAFTPRLRCIAERGSTFGERFENALEDVRSLGYDEIVAIGGDIPGLDGRRIAEAFSALASNDVVLGPSPDGGVYLIGARGAVGGLFAGVRWKTSSVFIRLRANAGGAAAILDPLRDIDRRTDLPMIAEDPALDPEILRILRIVLAPAAVFTRSPSPALRPRFLSSSLAPRSPPAASSVL